jgi:hypothetical protein
MQENLQNNHQRYSVHWGCDTNNQCTRYIVIVYDKLGHKVIYMANTKKLQKEFDYIKKHYGKEDCVPCRQHGIPVDLTKYL